MRDQVWTAGVGRLRGSAVCAPATLLLLLACGGSSPRVLDNTTQVIASVPLPSISVQAGATSVALGEPVMMTPVFAGGAGRLLVVGQQYGDQPVGPGVATAKSGAVVSGVTYAGFPMVGTQYYFEAINSVGQTMGRTIQPMVSDVSVEVVPSVAGVLSGGTANFGAVVKGALDSRVTWSVEGSGTVDANGLYTAPDAPGASKVWVTPIADPSRKSYGLASVRQVGVGVTPRLLTLHPGGQSDLRAEVVGTLNRTVSWTATGGVISGVGNQVTYLAPDLANDYVIHAVSQDDPRMHDETSVLVLPFPTASLAADALTVPRGGHTVLHARYSGGTATIDNGVGAVSSGGSADLTVAPASTTTYTMTVKSPLGVTSTAQAVVTVEGLSVGVSPTSAVLSVSGSACTSSTIAFVGTVSGAVDSTVTWSCTGGTVDGRGNYAAPRSPGDYTVTISSVQDPARKATASVKVVSCPNPTMGATPSLINPGQSATLMPAFADGQVGVVDQGVGAVLSGNGVTVTPDVPTTYVLQVENADGDKVTSTARVDVQALAVSVSPSASTLSYGDLTEF